MHAWQKNYVPPEQLQPIYVLSHLLALIITLAIMIKLVTANKDLMEKLKAIERSRSCSYNREPTLFSPSERSFFGVLEQVLGSEYKVFGKVRIADLLKRKSRVGRQTALPISITKSRDLIIEYEYNANQSGFDTLHRKKGGTQCTVAGPKEMAKTRNAIAANGQSVLKNIALTNMGPITRSAAQDVAITSTLIVNI
jgi:hypothetical protein